MRVLLALLLLAAPVKVPNTKVFSNGKLLNKPKNSIVRLIGGFTCVDGVGAAECTCPSSGMLLQDTAVFALTSQAQLYFDAPWVTDKTGIACGAAGSLLARFSYTLWPGSGFTVFVDVGASWLGSLSVSCIGAVPQ